MTTQPDALTLERKLMLSDAAHRAALPFIMAATAYADDTFHDSFMDSPKEYMARVVHHIMNAQAAAVEIAAALTVVMLTEDMPDDMSYEAKLAAFIHRIPDMSDARRLSITHPDHVAGLNHGWNVISEFVQRKALD